MKKILVPIDGSGASKNAALKAIELAQNYNSEITFISVIALTQYPNISLYADFDIELERKYFTMVNKINDQVVKKMDNLIDGLNISNIEYNKIILAGEPYVEILNFANKEDFDLIVMGKKGYSKVARFFLGSVTQRVISESPCPVLVVNE